MKKSLLLFIITIPISLSICLTYSCLKSVKEEVKQAVDIKADVETLEQTKIAFCSHREGIESYIYVMNTDGSEQKRLTKKRVAGSFPHWSPFIKSKK